MAQEMDTLVCDALIDVGAFPEVSPPPLKGKTWLLGLQYDLPQDKIELYHDVRSRLWLTYRKNFRAISGTNLTSDAGWGCTLRCGQMLVAQALLYKHLGREWRWSPNKHNHSYQKILKKFLDVRDSEYSIQMIALQGADFGRQPGQWLGPNNVAQAIRKLSVHDDWSDMAVHVAMDMVVVIEDLKKLCREPLQHSSEVNVTTETGDSYSQLDEIERRWNTDKLSDKFNSTSQFADTVCHHRPPMMKAHSTSFALPKKSDPSVAINYRESTGLIAGSLPTVNKQKSIQETFSKALGRRKREVDVLKSADFSFMESHIHQAEGYERSHRQVQRSLSPPECVGEETAVTEEQTSNEESKAEGGMFRSLLLFIPLRLGQDSFNMEYADSLKACLTLPQSVGFIGGRPRHAQYFIGYHGNVLWYLDPHTTQPVVPLTSSTLIPDSTYHCNQPDRMPINELDPSVAIGFYCKDEADVDDLCMRLKTDVLCHKTCYSMFELAEKRPDYWGPLETTSFTSIREPFLLVDEVNESDDDDDEGFEIINWPDPEAALNMLGGANPG